MQGVYNFSAGPTSLPSEVLKRAEAEIHSYNGTGLSVMELNHHSAEFKELLRAAETALRKLMNIPSTYRVLFLQGGASTQFSAVPLNLLSDHKCADYIVTGKHSNIAYKEAKKYGDIAVAASSAGANPPFSVIPFTERSDFRPDADYVHVCFNNTVYGTKYNYVPDTGNIPLVADMSSCILSEPIDVTRFALIYAGAQHNISIAGLTVVIIREDLIGNSRADIPLMLDYKLHADNDSVYNTPPVHAIYMAKLTFEWLLEIGGLEEMKRRNERKASLIYDYIDAHTYFTSKVSKECRSLTNIVFTTDNMALDKRFIAEAREAGLINLEGDPAIGGIRASIYNSMPYEGVAKLVAFMKRFSVQNPKLLEF